MRILIARIKLWWHCLTHLHCEGEDALIKGRRKMGVNKIYCASCGRVYYERS